MKWAKERIKVHYQSVRTHPKALQKQQISLHNTHTEHRLLLLHLPEKKRVENNIPAHLLENPLHGRIFFFFSFLDQL